MYRSDLVNLNCVHCVPLSPEVQVGFFFIEVATSCCFLSGSFFVFLGFKVFADNLTFRDFTVNLLIRTA